MRKNHLMVGCTFIALSTALATPAFAQGAAPATAPAPACVDENANGICDADEDSGTIYVTGSRIGTSPNIASAVPIATVRGDDLINSGNVSIGDTLNELPQLRSTLGQANSTRFLGTAGLNLLDLRGLGTQRTLVLVNGRRHVGSDILFNGVSPDTNTFPTDLIDRVDVVTGANSAVYGSDALAGVVNFILKRDFDGIQLRGQGGISRYEDAGAYFVSLTAGQNFADGRGNIAINLEYARQNDFYGAERPFLRQTNGFVTVDTDPAGTPGGSDGIPDTIFFRDIRNAGLTNTGVVRFGGNAALNGGRDPLGAFYNVPFTFQPDGTLVPLTGVRVGLGPNGSFIGGNGENFRGGRQFQLSPALDRYSANLIGHFTFSPAFEVFAEAKYSRTDVFGSGSSGPAFITGTTLGDGRERPRLDNPFLSDQARALITQQIIAGGGAAPTGATRFSLRENLLGLGVRNEQFQRETYRGVLGVQGDFNTDWHYEVSVNYGEFSEANIVGGNLNVQRFLLGIDAVRNPANNQIVCNAQINPAAAIDYGNVPNATILAADVAACTPINLFGGQFTDQQRAYLLQDTVSRGKITQFDVSGFVSGDLSQLFELPGGPIAFSIGGEYRRETNFYTQDPLVENGYTFYNSIPTFTSPAFEVKEAFGEIRLPLLRDLPLIEELTVSGAGRISDYKFGGTAYSYNAIVEYAPTSWLRFRGAYGRGVRAPNLGELFSPPGQNFAPGFADPCSARNLALGTANRTANCRAAGIPATYDFVYSQSLEIVSGGNQDLNAETSDSYTIGGVLTPSELVRGLSISVDYYDITVNGAIASVAAQTIVNQCYDLPTLNNQFCGLFARNTAAAGPAGEVQFQILEGSLLQSAVNFAGFKRRGIDVQVGYSRNFENFGTLTSRLYYTHVIQIDAFQDPTNPNFATRGLQGLGDPTDEVLWQTSLKIGKVTFGYDLHYIGEQLNVGYTSLFELNGSPPQNLDASETNFYPGIAYHDIRIAVDVTEKANFYFGINNIANQVPPLGASGIGGGSGIFDNRGRYYFAGFRINY